VKFAGVGELNQITIIPIATAYLGLEVVQAATAGGSGFSLGFLTLPTLFNNWGWFAPVAGAMWFGLLFFAGITSSLAMGQPIVAFLEDELKVEHTRAALYFGAATLLLGFICVWLYPGGAFDEFDFWSGTFGLVAFALGVLSLHFLTKVKEEGEVKEMVVVKELVTEIRNGVSITHLREGTRNATLGLAQRARNRRQKMQDGFSIINILMFWR